MLMLFMLREISRLNEKFKRLKLAKTYMAADNFRKLYLTLVFKKMKGANLRLKASKRTFANKHAKFLGHVVTKNGKKPNEENLDAVRTYIRPKSSKQFKSFTGLASCY